MEDLNVEEKVSEEEIQWREQARELVDVNISYYMPKFEKFRSGEKKVAWNWMGFLFPHLWLVYRKMYVEGIAIYVINSIIGWIYRLHIASIVTVTPMGSVISEEDRATVIAISVVYIMFVTVVYLALGFTVNRYYCHHIDNLIQNNLTPSEKEQRGGVSKPAVIIFVIVIAVCRYIF